MSKVNVMRARLIYLLNVVLFPVIIRIHLGMIIQISILAVVIHKLLCDLEGDGHTSVTAGMPWLRNYFRLVQEFSRRAERTVGSSEPKK